MYHELVFRELRINRGECLLEHVFEVMIRRLACIQVGLWETMSISYAQQARAMQPYGRVRFRTFSFCGKSLTPSCATAMPAWPSRTAMNALPSSSKKGCTTVWAS